MGYNFLLLLRIGQPLITVKRLVRDLERKSFVYDFLGGIGYNSIEFAGGTEYS